MKTQFIFNGFFCFKTFLVYAKYKVLNGYKIGYFDYFGTTITIEDCHTYFLLKANTDDMKAHFNNILGDDLFMLHSLSDVTYKLKKLIKNNVCIHKDVEIID